MPRVSAWIVRCALFWLVLGAGAGAVILARAALGLPGLARGIPGHAEVMLVGWMMQFAFGVAHWILPRRPTVDGRGAAWPVVSAMVALNAGVLAVVLGAPLLGRLLEVVAVLGYGLQAAPRIRAAGWGATGRGEDLVRLGRRSEMTG